MADEVVPPAEAEAEAPEPPPADAGAPEPPAAEAEPPFEGDGEAVGTPGGEGGMEGEEDFPVTVTSMPRYAMPSISSILPGFANSEQDHIRRAFACANYDNLHDLPSRVDYGTVNAARQAVMEAARKPFRPQMPTGNATVPRATNKNGLFHEYEYLPSRYSLADELAARERLESEEARMRVAGATDFVPCGATRKLKHEDGFEDGGRFPYASDPYEAAQDLALRQKWLEESRVLSGPFVPAGTDAKLGERPTRAMARDIITMLQDVIVEDWEGVDVAIYANEEEQWVIRFLISSVDSEEGLVAYMNVMLRCNAVVQKYKLTKVVEHWNVKPGDGHLYFTLRPPWVQSRPVETYYVLHPEARVYNPPQLTAAE